MDTRKTTTRLRKGWLSRKAGSVKGGRHVIGGVGAAHKDLAVREVDHPQHAVDHGVAHGDEGIDAPWARPKTMKSNQCRPAYRPAASVATEPTMTTPTTAAPMSHMTISVPVTLSFHPFSIRAPFVMSSA